MDEQTSISKQILDHRKHGAIGLLGLILGILFGRSIASRPSVPDPDRDLVQVTSTALDRGDDYWAGRLEPRVWRMPHVVLIDHSAGESTPCGRASSASGPFYCPANERIYVDLQFLRAIDGELARAYVTAHEIGHHIQKLRDEFDGRPSVSIELGADCYAGMWLRDEQQRGHLGPGDVAAALQEAAAVGDDRICPSCSTEQWTHGSSEQRVAALSDGIAGGACDRWRFAR